MLFIKKYKNEIHSVLGQLTEQLLWFELKKKLVAHIAHWTGGVVVQVAQFTMVHAYKILVFILYYE